MTVQSDELVSEATGHAILRCKTCKHAGRKSFVIRRVTRAWNGRPSTTVYASIDGGREHLLRDRCELARLLYEQCPKFAAGEHPGAGVVTVNIVKGVHVPDKTCDARCMNAVGPSCSCSCGGENHGGGHGSW